MSYTEKPEYEAAAEICILREPFRAQEERPHPVLSLRHLQE
jgi:hypothetical protein